MFPTASVGLSFTTQMWTRMDATTGQRWNPMKPFNRLPQEIQALTLRWPVQAERGKPTQRVGEEKASILDVEATTWPLSGAHPTIINHQEPLRSRRLNCDPDWMFRTNCSHIQQNSGSHNGQSHFYWCSCEATARNAHFHPVGELLSEPSCLTQWVWCSSGRFLKPWLPHESPAALLPKASQWALEGMERRHRQQTACVKPHTGESCVIVLTCFILTDRITTTDKWCWINCVFDFYWGITVNNTLWHNKTTVKVLSVCQTTREALF